MGFRQYDFACGACDGVHTDLIWVDYGTEPPDAADSHCPHCDVTGEHERVISAPAKYLYDRPYFPEVHGGKFDTMGGRKPPPMPELPDGATFDQARDFLTSAHMKDTMERRRAVRNENALKAQRAAAVKNGENLDLRNCRLPGDPPIEKVAKPKKKRDKPRKRAGSLHRVDGGRFGS